MYTFENTDTLEMDLYFEQAKYILSGMPSSDDIEYFTEGENIISRAIDAVVNAFKAFFKKLHEIITGKKRDDAINNLEEAIAENPELGKEKVNVHDYKEMRKLQDETFNKLKKPNCDVSATMDDYRKKRKNLLVKIGVGVGAAIATAGTAITATLLVKKLKSGKQIEAAAKRDGETKLQAFTQLISKSKNAAANVTSQELSSAGLELTRDSNADMLEEMKYDTAAAQLLSKRGSKIVSGDLNIDPNKLNDTVPASFADNYRFKKGNADERVPNKKRRKVTYQATPTGNLVRIQNDSLTKSLIAKYKDTKKRNDRATLHDAIIKQIKSMVPDADDRTVKAYFNALVS